MATSNIQDRWIENDILFIEEDDLFWDENSTIEEINNKDYRLDFYNHYSEQWDSIKVVCKLNYCYYEGANVAIYYDYSYSDTWLTIPDEVEISKTNEKKLNRLIEKMEEEIFENLPITKLWVMGRLSNWETLYKTI